VSQATITGDLRDLSTPNKSKPAKTASNPKGAGRPKGNGTKPRRSQRRWRAGRAVMSGDGQRLQRPARAVDRASSHPALLQSGLDESNQCGVADSTLSAVVVLSQIPAGCRALSRLAYGDNVLCGVDHSFSFDGDLSKPLWRHDGRDGDRHRRLQTGESAFPSISAYLGRTALTGRQ